MITIYCDNGHKPWTIAKFWLDKTIGWQQVEERSQAQRLELRNYRRPPGLTEVEAFLDGLRPSDKPLNSREIADGEETGNPWTMSPLGHLADLMEQPNERHTTYTFKCGPCQKRNRHATVTRRGQVP